MGSAVYPFLRYVVANQGSPTTPNSSPPREGLTFRIPAGPVLTRHTSARRPSTLKSKRRTSPTLPNCRQRARLPVVIPAYSGCRHVRRAVEVVRSQRAGNIRALRMFVFPEPTLFAQARRRWPGATGYSGSDSPTSLPRRHEIHRHGAGIKRLLAQRRGRGV